jgi:hypothetical protein
MVDPPLLVMLPPEVAVVAVIADAAVVVRVAGFVLGFLQEVNNKINRNGNSNFFIKENILMKNVK